MRTRLVWLGSLGYHLWFVVGSMVFAGAARAQPLRNASSQDRCVALAFTIAGHDSVMARTRHYSPAALPRALIIPATGDVIRWLPAATESSVELWRLNNGTAGRSVSSGDSIVVSVSPDQPETWTLILDMRGRLSGRARRFFEEVRVLRYTATSSRIDCDIADSEWRQLRRLRYPIPRFAVEVDTQARLVTAPPLPRAPSRWKAGGEALLRLVVSEDGIVDTAATAVLKAVPDEAGPLAVAHVAPYRFTPAVKSNRRVRQFVDLRVTFAPRQDR